MQRGSLFGRPGIVGCALMVFAFAFAFEPTTHAQTNARSALPMITQPVNETNLVQLFGNTRPEANASNDRGRVSDNFQMDHMFLQLRRPAAQEQALTQYVDQLHDPHSPNFHRWLTPDQLGAQFGPADSDIQKITAWLRTHGFRVNMVYPNGMTIDFSGTAGQLFAAFHTEIHNLEIKGVGHFANMSDPQIPAALAPTVVGIVSLHDFRPHRMLVKKPKTDFNAGTCGALGKSTTCLAVTPPDLWTIYNFTPVFTAGNRGQNQTIYLIEDSDLYSTSDWTTFRSTFGLGATASLNTLNPGTNCTPGVSGRGDDGEAILDAEWASAAAPGANIVMVSCQNVSNVPTPGVLIAIKNLINQSNSSSGPSIISVSYGECEALNGAVNNAAFGTIYQQAVAEGISIFVASGDWGAATCDASTSDNPTLAMHGINVNGFASTPYNVAVGGTDFGDTYLNANNVYWNSSGSATSYIPEISWNDSCASQLTASFLNVGTTYGSSGLCNNTALTSQHPFLLTDTGGGGGPSGCASGTPSNSGVVSGTCQGWPKPGWQTEVVGNPSDGVRDLPDVSLFAADGVWSHFYIYILLV